MAGGRSAAAAVVLLVLLFGHLPAASALYHTSGELLHWFAHSASKHPSLMRFKEMRDHHTDTYMPVASLTAGANAHPMPVRPVVLFVFGEHARELITSEVAVWLARMLVDPSSEVYTWPELGDALRRAAGIASGASRAANGTLGVWEVGPDWAASLRRLVEELLGQVEVQLVPIESLDSRRQVEEGQLCVRKTARNVDLNRNWPFAWRPESPTDEQYGGQAPFSEPQSRLVRQLVDSSSGRLLSYVNVHSGEWALYTPWDSKGAYGGGMPADMPLLVDKLGRMCNCRAGPAGAVSGYLAFGSSMDYVYVSRGVPYPLTVEVYGGGGVGKLQPGETNKLVTEFTLVPKPVDADTDAAHGVVAPEATAEAAPAATGAAPAVQGAEPAAAAAAPAPTPAPVAATATTGPPPAATAAPAPGAAPAAADAAAPVPAAAAVPAQEAAGAAPAAPAAAATDAPAAGAAAAGAAPVAVPGPTAAVPAAAAPAASTLTVPAPAPAAGAALPMQEPLGAGAATRPGPTTAPAVPEGPAAPAAAAPAAPAATAAPAVGSAAPAAASSLAVPAPAQEASAATVSEPTGAAAAEFLGMHTGASATMALGTGGGAAQLAAPAAQPAATAAQPAAGAAAAPLVPRRALLLQQQQQEQQHDAGRDVGQLWSRLQQRLRRRARQPGGAAARRRLLQLLPDASGAGGFTWASSVDALRDQAAAAQQQQQQQQELDHVLATVEAASFDMKRCFYTFNPIEAAEYRQVVAEWLAAFVLMLRHVTESEEMRRMAAEAASSPAAAASAARLWYHSGHRSHGAG